MASIGKTSNKIQLRKLCFNKGNSSNKYKTLHYYYTQKLQKKKTITLRRMVSR